MENRKRKNLSILSIESSPINQSVRKVIRTRDRSFIKRTSTQTDFSSSSSTTEISDIERETTAINPTLQIEEPAPHQLTKMSISDHLSFNESWDIEPGTTAKNPMIQIEEPEFEEDKKPIDNYYVLPIDKIKKAAFCPYPHCDSSGNTNINRSTHRR